MVSGTIFTILGHLLVNLIFFIVRPLIHAWRSGGSRLPRLSTFLESVRGLFDLLQEVIATLWQRIELFDKSIKKRQLPKSFRAMVLNDDRLRTVEAIQAQFHIPGELASLYYRHGPFFQVLRQYRDDVVHSGKDFASIFVTEKGFAVSADVEPFVSFGVWNEEHMLPNRLASLRPIVAHVINETLSTCEDFAQTIQGIIRFPPEIAPRFRLFLRGYHNHQLLAMNDVLKNCKWWETG